MKMKRILISLSVITVITATIVYAQGFRPNQLRVFTDATNALLVSAAAQTLPLSQPITFNLARLRTDASGNLVVSIAAGGAVAPSDATYITQTANSTLTNEQALSTLATGIIQVTTGTGVLNSTLTPSFTSWTTSSSNTANRAGIITTSTDGIVLQNATAATGAVTVQMSPRTRWVGNAWDTSASQTVAFFSEVLPATAATPTGQWKLGYSLNGAAATYPLTITSAGSLIMTGNLIGDTVYPGGVTRGSLSAQSDSTYKFTDSTGNKGGTFDLTTDAVFKFKDRANSLYATVDALGYNVGSKVLASGTAPTATTFCTSPSIPANNGTAAFTVNVGTTCATSVGTITFPTATTAWVIDCKNVTAPATNTIGQTGGTTTTVTITNYARTTGLAANWTDSNVLRCMAFAY